MNRPTPAAVSEPFRREEAPERLCDVPGCTEEGNYRAPKSRERLTDYYWFCLDHVRAYNAAWDYFADMSEEEIEAIRRYDTVWQRPSWPLGSKIERIDDQIDEALRAAFGFGADKAEEAWRTRRPQSEEEKALAALDLPASASFTEVKTRYKKLAKCLHPDANGGDRAAEERFKAINHAYAVLKKSFSPAGV